MRATNANIAIDHSIDVNIWIRFIRLIAEPKKALLFVIGGALPRNSPTLSTRARTAVRDGCDGGGMNVFGCPGFTG